MNPAGLRLFVQLVDIDRVEDLNGQNVRHFNQLLADAAGIVKFGSRQVELLCLLVGGAQRDGKGCGCAAVVSCADDERAAVGPGDRTGDRKAEACVRADDLQIPLLLACAVPQIRLPGSAGSCTSMMATVAVRMRRREMTEDSIVWRTAFAIRL